MALGSYKIAFSPELADFAKAGLDAGKQFGDKLEGSIPGIGNKVGGALKGIGGLAAGAAAAGGAAFIGLGASALAAQADIQQSLGGAEAVFKGNADAVKAWAASAAGSMGMSANAALETANRMGAIFQGNGATADQAADMTMKYTQRAADVASVMGVDLETAMNAVTGAAKGEFSMMDNLGVAMNVSTLEAYALSKGIDASWNSMSNLEKNTLAYEYFMDQTGYAAGNFAKENTSIAGSMDILKSSWENVLSSMGDPAMLEAAGSQLGTAIGNVVTALMKVLPQLLSGLITTFVDIFPTVLPQIIDGLDLLLTTVVDHLTKSAPQLMKGISDTLVGLVGMLGTIIPKIVELVIAMLPGLVQLLVDLIPVILQAVIDIFSALLKLLPVLLTSVISLLPTFIPMLLLAAIQLLTAIVDALPQIITALVTMLPTLVIQMNIAMIKMIPQLLEAAVGLFMAVVNGFGTIGPLLMDAVMQIISLLAAEFGMSGPELVRGLWEGIQGVIPWLMARLAEFGAKIMEAFTSFFNIKSPSRLMRDMVGKNLALGIGVGITAEEGNLLGIATDMSTKLGAALSVTASYDYGDAGVYGIAATGRGFEQINQTILVPQPEDMKDQYLINRRATLSALSGGK